MALKNKDGAPGEAETPQTAAARIADFVSTHRELLRRVGLTLSVLIIGVSVFIFGRTLVKIDVAQFERAFRATGADQIFFAFGLACTSYLALTGYDALALRHLG